MRDRNQNASPAKSTNHRGRFILLCFALFAVCFVTSAAIKLFWKPIWASNYQVEWSSRIGTVEFDIPYGDGSANKFDLYLPANKTDAPYGLVVYLHPGGFTGGDKSGDAEMCQWLCSQGFVAATINYTLFSDENPDASVYSQSVEIREAIPHVVEAARELGYPVDRMAIGGGSAGGCLALIYAYRDASTSPIPVKMVFEAVGPASMHHEDWTNYGLDQSAERAAMLLSTMAGQPIGPEEIESGKYLKKVHDISAADLASPDAPPTLMAYGEHDTVCPFLSSVRLNEALDELNIPHDYIVLPHSGHALQNDDTLYREYMDKLVDYLHEYLE